MYINQVVLENIRCFQGKHELNTSKGINVFIGNNNSGKSTLLKSIYHLHGRYFTKEDRTINAEYESIEIKFTTEYYYRFPGHNIDSFTNDTVHDLKVVFMSNLGDIDRPRIEMFDNSDDQLYSETFYPYPDQNKYNLIFPYFSNRKIRKYNTSVLISESERVSDDLSNLFAKIDNIVSTETEISQMYRESCVNILGFFVGTVQNNEGKHAAFFVDNDRNIPVTSMGDGVPHILGLIVDLCLAKNKIFLIEEIENDIHPKALKSLLNLIETKSSTNQFFISTHSNVVLRHLGANEENKIFHIISDSDFSVVPKIPRSYIEDVPNDPQKRMDILEDLGYDVLDYALWKGWLFLEESSAGTIIEKILIPNFAKNLKNKLRIFSTNGFDKISEKFKHFSQAFLYAHLSEIYKERAWVIIDAGEDEKKEIDKIIAAFSTWDAERHFKQLSEHDFEDYYPAIFAAEVELIKGLSTIEDRRQRSKARREAKSNLLLKVLEWTEANPELAKSEFENSASEIITILKDIDDMLSS